MQKRFSFLSRPFKTFVHCIALLLSSVLSKHLSAGLFFSWDTLKRPGLVGSELALESMHLQLKPDPRMRDAWARHYDTLGNIAMRKQDYHDAHALFLAALAFRDASMEASLSLVPEGNIAGVLQTQGRLGKLSRGV